MELDNAILAHHVWKDRLKQAISSKTPLDAVAMARDDCCEIGQWLHGELGLRYRHLPQFSTLLARHRLFHVEAGRVAEAINAQNYVDATHMMHGGTPFASASLAVGLALKDMQAIAR